MVILILLMLLALPLQAQNNEIHLWQNAVPGGENNLQETHNIKDTEFQDMQNVYTDEEASIKVVDGLLKVWQATGTMRYIGELPKVTGERYLIFVDSVALNYAKTSGDYTTLVSTISSNGNIWSYNYGGYAYIGDYEGDRWYFDGTTLVVTTEVPKSKYGITAWNRGINANLNVTGQHSKVQYSEIDDLNNFDETYYQYISKDDGEEITMLTQFGDETIVGKRHSLHKIIGLNTETTDDDDVIPLTSEIGCVSNKSVCQMNGSLYFLSENGWVRWTSGGYELLSVPITSTVNNMKELSTQTDTWVISSAADWNGGTLTNIDTTTVSGSAIWRSTGGIYNQGNSSGTVGLVTALPQTFFTDKTGLVTDIRVYYDTGFNASSIRLDRGDLSAGVTSYASTLIHTGTYIELASVGYSVYKYDFAPNVYLTANVTYYLYSNGGTIVSHHTGSGSIYPNGSIETMSTYDMCFEIYISSAEYISPSKLAQDAGEAWKQWEKFDANGTDLTNIDFYVRASGTSGGLSSASWVEIEDGDLINISTGAYIQWRSVLKSTSARVDDVTISYWVNGNPDSLCSIADLKKLRYYTSYTRMTSSVNDRIPFWQERNQSWSKITGLNITAMGYYKYDMYWGDNDGKIYRVSSDYTDFNGTAIEPMIWTKDFDFGLRNHYKKSLELWTSFEPTTQFSNATVQYYVNKATGAYFSRSVSLSANSIYPSMSLISKWLNLTHRFRTISFKISNFFKFNGLDYYFGVEPRE